MDKLRNEIKDKNNTQPKEQFTRLTKYALILCVEKYDKKYTTFDDIEAVRDDFRNAQRTAKMMGILPQNTLEIKDPTNENLNKHVFQLGLRLITLTKVLENETGIKGPDG